MLTNSSTHYSPNHKEKQIMADRDDWLGGYTLQELLGAAPVSKSEKQLKKESGKRGIVSATLGAPFRLVAALIKLPITIVRKLVGGVVSALAEIVRLPFRLAGALAAPWRKK
jgi:hypothetical protein